MLVFGVSTATLIVYLRDELTYRVLDMAKIEYKKKFMNK